MPGLYGNVGNTTVSGGNTTSLYSTTTPVSISNNLNVNDINASGNLFVAGTGTFGGNVTAPNFIGNLTGNVTGNISGNVVAPGANTEVIYNDNGQLGGDPDFTWNETTNVLTVNGNVTATGNVSGNYILGNGSQLTGLPATYGNANVQNYLANGFGSNSITTTGNVTAGYFIGNGSQLTGIVSSFGNANVAAYLPTYTGNLAGGNLAISNNAVINNDLTVGGTIFGTFSGNITGNLVVPGSNTEVIFNNAGNAGASANLTFNSAINRLSVLNNGQIITGTVTNNGALTLGSQNADVTVAPLAGTPGNVVLGYGLGSGNINLVTNVNQLNGNIDTTGKITATGNITGDYFFGNGSQLTGLPATYSNANVATFLANFGSNTIVTTGNITGGNFIGSGQSLTNIPGANVTGTVANATYATSAGSATTATSALTANTVTDAAQANITSVGTLTGLTVGGDQTITGNLIVGQNLTVNGNTIQVNITELNVQDPIIGLGRGENNAPLTSNDGKDRGEQLWYYAGSEKSAFTGYDNSAGNLILATDVTIANEIVTVNTWGTTQVGDLYAQGNINAGNVTAAGVVYTPQIESATSLDINSPSEVNVNANLRVGDNNTDTQIATHGTGDLVLRTHAGDANQGNIRLYDGASGNIDVNPNGTGKINLNGGVFTNDGITATGNVTGSYIIGNGSLLSNLTGANVTGTVANATYATSAGSATTATSATTAGTVTGNAQANITSVGTLSTLTVSGNIGTGGILTDNYYYANGTPISFGGTYGNANVSNFLANGFGSNSITTTGNIQTGNLLITGSLSNPTGNAIISDTLEVSGTITANVNVGAAALALFNYDPSGLGLSITAGNGNYSGGAFNVVTVTDLNTNTLFNIGSPGNVSTRGNIKAGNVTYTNLDGTAGQVLTTYGNGITYFSTVSGGSYGNANVANFLANGFGSNTIVTTGNITAANLNATTAVVVSGSAGNITGANYITANYFVGNGSGLTSVTAAIQGNLAGNLNANGFYLNNLPALTTSGNVTANYFQGNGSQLTGVVTSAFTTVNANSTSIVADSTSDTLTINAGSGINITGNATTDTITISTNGQANALSANLDVGNFEIYSSTAANVTVNDGLIASRVTATGGTGVVTTNLTASQTITATGNIQGSNIFATGILDVAGNATVQNLIVEGGIEAVNSLVEVGNILLNSGGSITQEGAIAANVVLNGYAQFGGNITSTSGYFIGNGSQLTGIVASGSNSFSTIAANGTNIVAVTSTDTLTLTAGSGISITGNATSDTITIAATGGGGSPGGADTQLQFNDGGSFAGNAQMTFSKTTGNVAFGNLIIQSTNPNSTAVISNTNSLNPSARPLLGRVAIGSGFNGDYGNTGDYFNGSRNSAVAIMNRWDQSSSSNTTPIIGTTVNTWLNNTSGNTITSAANARGMEVNTYYTGSRWGTAGALGVGTYNAFRVAGVAGNGTSGGNVATLVGASLSVFTAGSNSTINDSVSILAGQGATTSGANNGNVYGLTFNMNSTNPTVGNTYLIHNQVASSGTHNTNFGMGGNFRSATRYFMLRNDDDVAQVKLGSLRTYHEFLGNATQSTSSITIGPRQGPGSQVVRTTPTEAITSVTFTGFITSASDGTNTDFQTDTMTWIIQQGATPYAVTLPTGNTAIRYAGGVTTVAATANAVTMVAVTAYDNGGTTNYLVTVSPEFQQV